MTMLWGLFSISHMRKLTHIKDVVSPTTPWAVALKSLTEPSMPRNKKHVLFPILSFHTLDHAVWNRKDLVLQ